MGDTIIHIGQEINYNDSFRFGFIHELNEFLPTRNAKRIFSKKKEKWFRYWLYLLAIRPKIQQIALMSLQFGILIAANQLHSTPFQQHVVAFSVVFVFRNSFLVATMRFTPWFHLN